MLHYKQNAPRFVKGGHRPKPFPGGFPTRIYYKLFMFKGAPIIYLGKPNVEIMRRFRRLLRANRICRYTIAEFDKSGTFAMVALDVRYIGGHANHVSERFWRLYHPFDAADPTLSCFAVPFEVRLAKQPSEKGHLYYLGRPG